MPKLEPQGFTELAAHFSAEPDVELPEAKKNGFGSAALRCKGKIFAMSPDGQSLVVKLTAARVADVIAAGDGMAYSMGNGKVMKEWATIPASRGSAWVALAEEALACSRVGGR